MTIKENKIYPKGESLNKLLKLSEERIMKIYQCFPNSQNLDFWIKNNLNVLLFGRHGVGKTSIILEAFARNNIRCKQFSAATMDPWVDFIGVPKEMKDDKGSYLELIRPKDFRDDEVEAIFFDELNRSHKKVRNAVMELIQFKSINGKKYPNLKMIWAAVNPEEDETLTYDVEKLDPAQQDRFHIQVEIPYKPYMPYFVEKYGKEKAQAAVDWWAKLPDNIKQEVSPRRLEYALKINELGGNLIYVLPPYSNVDKLIHAINNGSPLREYQSLFKNKEEESKIKDWLSNENNYEAVREEIMNNPEKALHLLSEEKIISLISINKKTADYVFNNFSKFKKVIESVAENSTNKNLKKSAISVLQSNTGQSNPGDLLKICLPRVPATVRGQQSNIATSYKWNSSCKIIYEKVNKTHYQLENCIAGCLNAAINCNNQTYERKRIIESLIKILSQKPATSITKEEALSSMLIFEWYASKTQSTSLLNTQNIEVAINNCVNILRNHEYIKEVKDFANKYPFISAKIIANERNQGLKCLIPI